MQKIKKLFAAKGVSVQDVLWLFQLLAPYRARLLGLTMLRCAITAVGIASALVNKQLVDWASAFFSVRGAILMTVACSGISLLGSALLSDFSARLIQHCTIRIRTQLYEGVLASLWTERTRLHSEDHLSRLISDTERICDGAISAVTGLAATLLQFCLAFALLYSFDRTIACFALGSIPLLAACSLGLGIYLKRLHGQIRSADAACRVLLQEQLARADVIKAFEQEQGSTQALTKLWEEQKRLAIKGSRCSLFMRLGVSGAFSAAYLFALITGALKIASGSITFGTMTAFLSLVNQVQSPALSLSNILSQLTSVWASAARVREIAVLPREARAKRPITVPERVGISARNLSFSYQENTPILKNLSFEIAPGQIVAVMGPSGIGKTTLIRLLLGFLNAQDGLLAFTSNEETWPCSPDSRSLISYVPQGNTLFSGTIAENLRLGCPQASDEQLLSALQMACADQFVLSLPEGLNTRIGENGQGLSEGQAQRLAIARAFLRPAPVLIWDEATSALDEQTELHLLRQLKKQGGQRTCIIVSHRSAAAQFADQVITL